MHIDLKDDFLQESDILSLPNDHILVKYLTGRNSYGKKAIDTSSLDLEYMKEMYASAKEHGYKPIMNQLSQIIDLTENPDTAIPTRLKAFAKGLLELVKRNHIKGWVFRQNGTFLDAYLIDTIEYKEANSQSQDMPFVLLKVIGNDPRNLNKNMDTTLSLNFYAGDLKDKRTLSEVLLKHGIFIENEQLHSYYDDAQVMYDSMVGKHSEQFWFNGTIRHHDYGYNSAVKSEVQHSRCVNDEDVLDVTKRDKWSSKFWRNLGYGDNFEDIPQHHYIYMFNLDLHINFHANVRALKEYVYDKTVKDKLVLPVEHRDLIDILVEDMDILFDDIVRGKSGGTTILSTGGPGLGKTLSAEVYSEIIERPLYRVQSGQLGIGTSTIETNLKTILLRAARWKAVLLIDEADVYIRRRDNSMEHNAVVATFLRTLEYFDGLLFLTTNRGDDVDDAILSRCIAVIDYKTPAPADAKRIWGVLAKQFGVDMPDGLIDELVVQYPTASGRDIKELLKLTARYAKSKQLPLSSEVFQKMAQFRRF